FRTEFPLTSSGKIDRKALINTFQQQEDAVAQHMQMADEEKTTPMNSSSIELLIREVLISALRLSPSDGKAFSSTTSFWTAGGN
ncbi:hypothetical protein ACKI1S_49090, partial [Streptomyces galilaeus]